MPWKLTYEGAEHREDDLTIAQAERIEALIGESWLGIVPLRSAKHAKAILTVMHAASTGEAEAAVSARVDAMRVSDFLTCVGKYEDDLPSVYEDGFPQ